MASDAQSPAPFVLSPNNDQLEREQARAARAAANRRKAATVTGHPSPATDPCLSEEQVAELFQRCIKLASENKINQKNGWELNLIDHLSDIIKVEAGNDSETNFQKVWSIYGEISSYWRYCWELCFFDCIVLSGQASCTLEARVKIYSVRVDSVHAEVYKVLGRVNRAGFEDEQGSSMENGNVSDVKDKSRCKKEVERKVSPLTTLESSFEALNLKKFDVAFVVDPLYHQTPAQFDEGGAKGLLLNNLGVYGRCQVLFDSSEVPGKCKSSPMKFNALNMIDLSFEKESIMQMVTDMLGENEISPTLNDILCHIDKDDRQSTQASNITQNPDLSTDAFGDNEVGLNFSPGRHESTTIEHEHDDDTYVSHEDVISGETFQSHLEDNNSCTSVEADMGARFEEVSEFLLQGLAVTSKKNAGAGPDHWKYWRPKEDAPASPCTPTDKRSKKKNVTQVDLVFTTSVTDVFLDIFSPPKNLKSLLLPANRLPSHRLPEDCHYIADDLVKLFLLPNALFLGKRRRNDIDDNSWEQRNNHDEPSWGDDSVANDHSSVEDFDTLISQPRQVTRIEVQYDRTSKRIDLHALKKTLWDHMQEFVKDPEVELKDAISFKGILSTFPINHQAAMPEDISPHLCFICLLHLANEHALSIQDFPSLDDLSIHLPSCVNSSDGVV